jgi:CRISP-associated protein Cas1
VTEFPWVSVCGYGAHIKSTQKKIVIQRKNALDEYHLDSVKHLLVVGGHTISSSTVNQLLRQGTFISFFESDGTPTGMIRPYGDENAPNLHELQKNIPRQRYAISFAQASIKSRLFAIERAEELKNSRLFYDGELEIISKSQDEMTYLIKLDEIRRLHRLTSDMYYEVMSRCLPSDLGFRRRTVRPHTDPVNAMLSLGYAMLYGNCCVAVIGARLDPDAGFMHDGKGSLVNDLIDPLKAGMVDPIVFRIAIESLRTIDFELSSDRCILTDELIKTMILAFYTSFNNNKINEQVQGLLNAISDMGEFKALY